MKNIIRVLAVVLFVTMCITPVIVSAQAQPAQDSLSAEIKGLKGTIDVLGKEIEALKKDNSTILTNQQLILDELKKIIIRVHRG